MNDEVQVAIIGGGAMGVGLLYHLAHEGWTDIALLEKGELTSGSTWHAAGLVPHFIGSLNMAKVHAEAPLLYDRLEEETGLFAGWHPTGAIRLALTDNEVDWFRYVQGMLDLVGVESHLISPEEILNKKVMVLINLKPRKMMGFESQGMLLLADDGDGNLSLMQPDSNISDGSVVA